MPRYYLDIRQGADPDEEGLELPSIERVQEEAARSIADMARSEITMIGRVRDGQSKSATTRPGSSSPLRLIGIALSHYVREAKSKMSQRDLNIAAIAAAIGWVGFCLYKGWF